MFAVCVQTFRIPCLLGYCAAVDDVYTVGGGGVGGIVTSSQTNRNEMIKKE
jgi:hypothetical protein